MPPCSESEESDAPSRSRSPRKSAGKAVNGLATPLRKTGDALSTSASTVVAEAQSIYPALQARGKRSLESLGNMFKAGAAETRAEVADVAHEVEARGEAVAHAVKRQQRAALRKTHKAWRDVGLYASDARNLTTVLVGLEFAALLLSIIPTRDISLGSSSAFASSWSVPVPSLWVVFVPAFWRVLLIWGFWTVAVPTFLSQLITFDRRRAPSIQTFTLARLFLILALVRLSPHLGLGARHPPSVLGVAAGQVPFGAAAEHTLTGWQKVVSYDWVSAAVGPDLQLINAAAAASFAIYEAIAVRPRAG